MESNKRLKANIQEVQTIRKLAVQMSEEYVTLEQILDDAVMVESELMHRVLEAAAPAISALSTRICSYEEGLYDAEGKFFSKERRHFEMRGLVISSETAGPSKEPARGYEGRYLGTDIFLMEDGSLAEARYAGEWSNPGVGEWTATLRVVAVEDIVEPRIGVRKVVKHLLAALSSQVGSREKKAKMILANSRRLQAILTLLEK